MIDTEQIRTIAEEQFQGTDLFLVGIKQSTANEIEVIVDSDTTVDIDTCAALTRKINDSFDREVEDFSLTVMSAGIGQPLVLPRQYRKMIGKEVEVVLKEGTKLIATLKNFADDTLTLVYTEKVAVEGKKRKVATEVERNIALCDIKTTKEQLNFK